MKWVVSEGISHTKKHNERGNTVRNLLEIEETTTKDYDNVRPRERKCRVKKKKPFTTEKGKT